MITDVFLDQKRVNVCEHTVKMVSHVYLEKCHQRGRETRNVHHLYCVSTNIYSLLIKKDLCECQNISVKLLCIYLWLIRRALHFLCKSFLLLFLLLVKFMHLWWCSTRISSRDTIQSVSLVWISSEDELQ